MSVSHAGFRSVGEHPCVYTMLPLDGPCGMNSIMLHNLKAAQVTQQMNIKNAYIYIMVDGPVLFFAHMGPSHHLATASKKAAPTQPPIQCYFHGWATLHRCLKLVRSLSVVSLGLYHRLSMYIAHRVISAHGSCHEKLNQHDLDFKGK